LIRFQFHFRCTVLASLERPDVPCSRSCSWSSSLAFRRDSLCPSGTSMSPCTCSSSWYLPFIAAFHATCTSWHPARSFEDRSCLLFACQ